MIILKNIAKIFVFIIWIYFLFTIRVRDYGRFPFAGHADELNYGWSGISLIREGKPFGWSYHPVYPKSWVFYDGIIDEKDQIKIGGRMVRPWLDEPPLFSILAGGVSHLYGERTWSVLLASHIRIPSIIFGTATTIILFLWAFEWYGIGIGMLTTSIYTLTPLILFSSRLALPENGISFIFTLCLYLFFRKQQTQISWKLLVLISTLIGLSGLMKPTGFFIIFLIMFWLVKYKLYKKAIAAFIMILPFVGLFLAYGYWQGGADFWAILKTQGFRPTGWTALGYIFTTPYYSTSNEPLYDGWYIFLLIGSIYLTLTKWKDSKIKILSMAFIFWLAIVVISAGEQDPLAWYRFPMFPIISFLGTILIIKIIKKPSLMWGFLSIGLFLSSRSYLQNAFNPNTSTYVFKFMCILMALPFIVDELYPNIIMKKLKKIVLICIISFGLFLNARYIYRVFTIKCQSIICTLQPNETKISKLKLPFMSGFPFPNNF